MLELHRRAPRSPASTAEPRVRAGAARRRCAARCSTSRAPRPSSAGAPATPLADGLAAPGRWATARRSPRASGEIRAPVDAPLLTPHDLVRPWRRATVVASRGRRGRARAACSAPARCSSRSRSRTRSQRHAAARPRAATPLAPATKARSAIKRMRRARRPSRAPRSHVRIMVLNGNGQTGAAGDRGGAAPARSATRSPAPRTRSGRTTRRASSCTAPASAPRACASRRTSA